MWLTRLAENGTVLWQREYDDCYWGTDIKECQDGGFILTASEPDIIRTDANGVILWNYTSDWYRCHAGSVIECDNGDFVCTGGMALADSYYDAFLIRLNGSGHVLWDETYNYDALDIGNDLIQCDDGGFAIAGESGSYNYYPRGFWFLRTYGNGTVLFEESYFNGDARSIVQCPDGGFALAGIYTPSADYSEWDAAFVRTDAVGNELWTSFCTGPSETRAHSLIFNNESGYVVSGWAEWDVEVTTDNETIIYGGHLPFLWRLDVNATDTVILSLDETNTTATDVTTTTETTSETTTTTTTTTETTSVTTTTEVTTTSSTTTSATNTTQSQLFDTNLVMIVGLSSGVIVIVIFCVGVKALRPSRS